MRTSSLAVFALLLPAASACVHEIDDDESDVDIDSTSAGDGALDTATCGPVQRPARPASCPFDGNELLIWASEGWNALGDVVAADLSACTDVYITIPPVTADKTKLRLNEAANMRARGPQMHAVAEFHYWAWKAERDRLGISWREVGRRFRDEMEAKGYCVAAGDTWAVQEAPSLIRKSAAFRDGFAELLRGLHEGRAGMPTAKGAVLVVGMGHRTQNTSVYEASVKEWLKDAPFWVAANSAVRFWAQEVYVDPTFTCLGASAASYRRQRVNEYAEHFIRLAFAPGAPTSGDDSIATARSFLNRTYTPLLNAVWDADPSRGYGDTTIPLSQMKRFVRMQVDATRSYADTHSAPDGRIGFGFGSYATPKEWEDIAVALADSVRGAYGNGAVAGGACDGEGCACAVDAAAGNPAWAALGTW